MAPARPMASVPTERPPASGRWNGAVDGPTRSSIRSYAEHGELVMAAVMPGRCAAPPAPAMITRKPSVLAPFAKLTRRSGVRWAETMRSSWATPSASSVSAACFIVAQSDWLPMMMAMGGEAGRGKTRRHVWDLALVGGFLVGASAQAMMSGRSRPIHDDAVLQQQLPLLQALDLKLIGHAARASASMAASRFPVLLLQHLQLALPALHLLIGQRSRHQRTSTLRHVGVILPASQAAATF